MTEQIKQIAQRLKGIREIEGVSAQELASRLGIDISLYLKYEKGEVDIPVSFLYEVSACLKVELTALLTGENPKLHNYCVVRKGKGINVERRKEYKYQHLAYNFVQRKMEPFIVKVEPENENLPISSNSHQGQEFNYIIEGSLKIVIDGHEILLYEGDSIYFDSGLPHGMRAAGNKPARFLALITTNDKISS